VNAHRRGERGAPGGASVRSFDPAEPDDRQVDDAGTADIHQGRPAGIEDEPEGAGIFLPDTAVERQRQGEHATTDGILTEDD
jgi:hypothetical protein